MTRRGQLLPAGRFFPILSVGLIGIILVWESRKIVELRGLLQIAIDLLCLWHSRYYVLQVVYHADACSSAGTAAHAGVRELLLA